MDTGPTPPLASGGGYPHDSGMEARVARLEDEFRLFRADLAAIRADQAAMRADIGYIKGRLEGVPTTWQMVTTVLGGNVALVGLFVAVLRLPGHF